MAISFKRYVDITSGVAGNAVLTARALIARLFTSNPLLPPSSLVEMDNADDVAAYFGSSSEEYARALFYFGWISKNITAPQRICFARYVNVACAPVIWGAKTPKLLATFQSITAGQLSLNLGGTVRTFGPLDFSGAGSLAAVAAIMQAAIQGSGSPTLWSAATVVFDAQRSSFNFTGGVATSSGVTSISVTDGAQNLAAALGWTVGAILGEGSAAEVISDTLSASANFSNNFGSFLIMPTVTLDEATLAAAWNATQNVLYQYTIAVAPETAADWSAGLIGYAGTELTLNTTNGEYPEMVPMMITAATNYQGTNATQNFMFQQFNLTPSVSDDEDADTYDALRVNYYGNTQDEGQQINFYQRGLMMGGNTAPVDMNTYANEQWLKSRAGGLIMSLQLALAKISANAQGRRQILTQLQSGLIGSASQPGTALGNGVISVGKTLTSTQQLYITNQTNDPNAWRQVQGAGYWLDVVIAPYTNDVTGLTEYKATYTLVYSKDDVVRLVVGTHTLI